ncbi:MAG: sialidase family protein [Gaiellaceae bacterium]
MKRTIRLTVVGLVALAGVLAVVLVASGGTRGTGTQNNVLANAISVDLGAAKPTAHRAQVSGGVVTAALDFTGALDARASGTRGSATPATPSALSQARTQGCQNVFHGDSTANVRVNQDCSLRRQAEEVIVADPNNPNHLIAGQNDSRLGFNKCGYDWSLDGGRTWGDQVPPFYQFLMGDGHTADACSDPTATFDSQGNVYVAGVLFDIASPASAFVVAKSNADAGGTFYHTPVSGPFQEYSDSPLGIVASDNDPNVFNDKEFIVADATASSPKADNVYATWTRFNGATGAGVGGDSPIYFSQSTDGGATWSPGIEISGSNPAYCTDFSGETDPNACDQDQGSHPVVGTDGTIYVAFGNGNTPEPGVNQHLMVKCPATADCTDPASWTAPSKIGDDFGFQPFGPDASTGCPAGRQCLPPNGYRLEDFVQGSIAVDANGTLYSAWADGRNIEPNCNPLGPAATATPPCDNDVFYAYSTDGGATWSDTVDVTPKATVGDSAQWQPWSAVSPDGKHYFIAYYDRSYGDCETSGCNDITLATISRAATGSPTIAYHRITTSSMPNLVPANNPVQAGFLGDYMWVSTDVRGKPLIVWADTRGLRGTVEENIYAATP